MLVYDADVISGSSLTSSSASSAVIPEVETSQQSSSTGNDLHLSACPTPNANVLGHSAPHPPFVRFSRTADVVKDRSSMPNDTDMSKDRLTGSNTDMLKDRLSLRSSLSAPYRRDSNFYIRMARGFGHSPALPSGFVNSVQTLESGVRRGLRIDRKGFVKVFGFRRYPTVLPDLDPELGRRPRRSFDLDVEQDAFPDLVPVARSSMLRTRSQSTSSLQDMENGNGADTPPPGDNVVRTYEDAIRKLLPYPLHPPPHSSYSSFSPPFSAPPLGCVVTSSDIYCRTAATEKRKMTSPEDSLAADDAMDTAV